MSQVWPPAPPGESGAITDPPFAYTQWIYWNGAPIRCLPWHVACLVTTFVLVVARVFIQAKYLRVFGWEDTCLVIAWILVAAFSATVMHATHMGFGSPLWEIPLIWATELEVWSTTAHALYSPAAMMLKLTFLLSTLRAFGSRKAAKVCCWLGIGVVAASHITTLFVSIYGWSTSTVYNYDNTYTICKYTISPLVAGVLTTITTLYVLILPVAFVNWRSLGSSWAKLIQAVVVYAAGTFCLAASIIRAGQNYFHSNPECGYYYVNEYDPLAIWTMLELVMGLVAASLLVFSPMVERFTRPRATPKSLEIDAEDNMPETRNASISAQPAGHDLPEAPASAMSEKERFMALATEKELR